MRPLVAEGLAVALAALKTAEDGDGLIAARLRTGGRAGAASVASPARLAD